MANRCLFCNDPLQGRRAKEHVFPQWLLDHLAIREHEVVSAHLSSRGLLISTRPQRLSNMIEGRICTTCNNGWMSELEGINKATLVRLLVSTTSLRDLTAVERTSLARWACKTIWMLHLSSNYRRTVPYGHLHSLCEEAVIPPNVIVVGAQHRADHTFSWLQSPTWVVDTAPIDVPRVKAVAEASYKISIQLRDLLLLVAWWPESMTYGLGQGVHVPLWVHDPVTWHSKADWPEITSERSLYAFHTAVTVAVHSGRAP